MKHCQNCNEPNNDDNAIFCLNCGYRFQSSENNSTKEENRRVKISFNPLGVKFIIIYEGIVSSLFIYFGLSLVSIESIYTIILSFLENNTNASSMQLVGIVFIMWGILGYLALICLYEKKKLGYYLTCVFIASQGAVFFWLIFPLLITTACFVYFDTNDSFIYIFRNKQFGKNKSIFVLDRFLEIF